MDFFISWTDSDPQYQVYDANCSLLLSPPIFPRSFRAASLACPPRQLMVDSGAYTLRRSGQIWTQADLLAWQLSLLEGTDLNACKVTLVHLDDPIEPGRGSAEAYASMERTLARAWDFLTLAQRWGLEGKVEFLGVIQGYDLDSIRWSAREMKRLGFSRYGLGSLAMIFKPKEIIARIQAAADEVGPNLHIFGISSVKILQAVQSLGVRSVDSSRPVKEAMFYVLLYSDPFGRYAVAGRRTEDMGRAQLSEPLPCDCPICRVDPSALFLTGAKRHTNSRAVHNYYHLKRAVCGATSWMEQISEP